MSEADAETVPGRGTIWVEKYRPQTLDDVAGHDDIAARLQSYIEQNDLPNLLFSGQAGVGQDHLRGRHRPRVVRRDWRSNFLELNASDERGIDVVRDQIKNFARHDFGARATSKSSS